MMTPHAFLYFCLITVSTIAITVSSTNGIQISKYVFNSGAIKIEQDPKLTALSKPLTDVHHRSKRYVLHGERWKSNNLTYRVINYPDTLSKADVDFVFARAFNLWTTYTYLTFTPTNSDPVVISIKFLRGDHDDEDPFDGPGGTLAHSFFPMYGSEIHFDADEEWTFDKPNGTNLFQAAFHEIGHALGLSHSDEPDAIMAPYYNTKKLDLQLDFDDISGIQALYGIKAKPEKASNKLCKNIKIDAIFNADFGKTVIFKDEFYFLLHENPLDDDYIRFISQGWPELPGNIDAAFLHESGKTFFFQGDKYWRYTGRQIDVGFPKNISADFKGVPGNLDAALYRKNKNEAYFFKNQFYWIYSFSMSIASDAKSIADLGLPNNLNAAFEHKNGHAYFFKNENYYQISNISTHASDLYPSSTKQWLSCEKGIAARVILSIYVLIRKICIIIINLPKYLIIFLLQFLSFVYKKNFN